MTGKRGGLSLGRGEVKGTLAHNTTLTADGGGNGDSWAGKCHSLIADREFSA